ncbi:MAG: Gfo/Idh/MocA family oxidoreductase [Anaerolineales bacterium]|nr:Gfo/Idh/MocA family oxidoreductase [Anaerolineales bacterium]
MTDKIRMAMIGVGSMARHHIRQMLQQTDTTEIVALCEPSEQAYQATAELFTSAGLEAPPNQPDIEKLLADFELDASFIITPHAYHHDQTVACMQAGLDVLLEKPMVMNAAEAESLIETRDRTGKLLVVAFPGSLSPNLRTAVNMVRSGEFGDLLSVSATVWQGWAPFTVDTWRQQPELSGGGFLFDTGAHMLNTVVDLAGEEFAEVSAWWDDHGAPVETMAVVLGRLASGALVTFHACGETINTCASDIRAFYRKGIVRTGMWGEFLEVQRQGDHEFKPVDVPPSLGVWEQFLAVRAGELPNPCPPEVGLRMSKLYDAIKASAAQNGKIIPC